MAENSAKKTAHIRFLGDFTIEMDGKYLTSNDMSNQICNLFAYLLVNRDNVINVNTIVDSLWPDGVASPSAAMKNLAYRFRKLCAQRGFDENVDLIVSTRGSYKVNPDIYFDVDYIKFDSLIAEASDDFMPDSKKTELLSEAVSLYKGTFCPNLEYKEWVVPIAQRYSSRYFHAVYDLLECYRQTENWDMMLSVAKDAADIDVFEENTHKYIMYALSKQGNAQAAISHYSHIRELYFKELGIELTARTRALYNEIAKSVKTNSTDIMSVMGELNETMTEISSAYYCEYEVFKQLYRFEARSALRIGSSYYVALISAEMPEGGEPEKLIRDRAMDQLHETISKSLRKCDVFSKCSSNQYVILLHMINYENSVMVMNRIEKRFKDAYHSRKVELNIALQPLEPAGWY